MSTPNSEAIKIIRGAVPFHDGFLLTAKTTVFEKDFDVENQSLFSLNNFFLICTHKTKMSNGDILLECVKI